MHKAVPVTAAALVAVGACLAPVATAVVPPVGVPASTVSAPARVRALHAVTYDGRLHRLGPASGHWTTAGGNGSEVLARSTATGQLVELGGSFPFVSDDDGRTWSQVEGPPSVLDGEGAVVSGHLGEVYAVSWAPYAGDRLDSYRADPATGWLRSVVPAHSPVYDRPWITYAPGPFTVNGSAAPFVTLIHGSTAPAQAVTLLSTDGLTYLPTMPAQDMDGATPSPLRIPVKRNPDADFWQPSPYAFTLPLSGGGLLLMRNRDDGFTCPAGLLDPGTGHWRCVRLGFDVTGTLRQDSRGWLTMLSEQDHGNDSAFRLAVSTDGGAHWRSTLLVAPHGGRTEGSFHYDVVVDGRRGLAAVASRFLDGRGRGQDLVWEVDVGRPQPVVRRVVELGRGDDVAPGGADFSKATASVDRVDFPTVAVLPDGSIAASFTDSTTPNGDDGSTGAGHAPALAVLDP